MNEVLNINMEFRKGALFIRLEGSLTKNTVSKLHDEVTNLVKENGIRNIVFNVSNLKNIDIKGINSLFYNYELNVNNRGRTCLCGLDNAFINHRIRNSRLLNYMYEATDELSALNIINL